MIEKVEAYCANCDICKTQFESPFEGFSIFNDDSYLSERLDEDGWHIEGDKTYCDKCHHFNDEDELVLKEPINPPTQ